MPRKKPTSENATPATKPAEESPSPVATPEIIDQPATIPETMEVHHHPDLHHDKKNFREYFLEFLMIFLAVTMGFFAENLREHISDSVKEHDYVVSIRKNLVQDTTNLNIWIPEMYIKIGQLDSLISYLEIPNEVKNGADMYYYARLSTRTIKFQSNDNAIHELENSDNFRLIRNPALKNGLLDFEKIVNNYLALNLVEQDENGLTYPLIGNLFDAAVLDKMLLISKIADYAGTNYAKNSRGFLIRPPGNPQLRNNDKDQKNLLIYYVHQHKSSVFGEARMLRSQISDASKLIKLIDKDYNIHDEQ